MQFVLSFSGHNGKDTPQAINIFVLGLLSSSLSPSPSQP